MSQEKSVVEVEFDHNGPEFAADRIGATKRLRDQCPVVRSTAYDGFYVLTDYEGVHDAAANSQLFSSQPRANIPLYPEKLGMMNLDPPDGPALRRQLAPLFTRSVAEALRPRIQQIVDERIDGFIERGSCDFVRDLTGPVSATVTAEGLGVPVERASEWANMFHDLLSGLEPDLGPVLVELQALLVEMASIIEDRANEPKQDWLSALLAVEVGGRLLTREEVLQNAHLFFVAGSDTTSATTANALLHLNGDRELRDRLRNDPSLMPAAIEEFVRYYSVLGSAGRTVTADTTIAGVPIEGGKRALLCWNAANRDPAVFEDPDTFNIDRERNRHLAFGHGNHKCIGQHLARVQIEVMLTTVLRRMPDFDIDQSAIRPYVGMLAGIASVQATFTPGNTLTPA